MVLAGGPDFPVPSLVGPDISTMSYVVRTTISSSELMPLVQQATHSVDPQLALAQVRTLQDVLDRASAQMAFTMVLVAIAASVALWQPFKKAVQDAHSLWINPAPVYDC